MEPFIKVLDQYSFIQINIIIIKGLFDDIVIGHFWT